MRVCAGVGAKPQRRSIRGSGNCWNLLIAHPECLPWVRVHVIAPNTLAGESAGGFTKHVAGWPTGPAPTFDRLMLEFDEPAVKSLLVELDETRQAKGQPAADPQALLR